MRLPCQNPNHPFKSKMYNHSLGVYHADAKYCPSCSHFFRTMSLMLNGVLQPHPTLYGNQEVELTKEQAHQLVDEIYAVKEAVKNEAQHLNRG